MSSTTNKLNGTELTVNAIPKTTTTLENRLNNLNHLNSINLLNNDNDIQIKKEFEINGNVANSSSDSENSDEILNDKNICVDNSGNK